MNLFLFFEEGSSWGLMVLLIFAIIQRIQNIFLKGVGVQLQARVGPTKFNHSIPIPGKSRGVRIPLFQIDII